MPFLHISKSDSRNEVHYAVALDAHCRLAETPVRAFWLRRGDPARPPRPLSWIEEQLAYGVRVLESGEQRVVFSLAADETRPVTVEAWSSDAGCRLRARLRVLGEWVEPRHAFVTIRQDATLFTMVSHVELHARRPNGEEVCERIRALRAAGTPCSASE